MPAAHLFMKLTGANDAAIEGESEVTGYSGQIVLEDWSWEISRTKKDDRAVTEPSLLSFSKEVDRSTTTLLNYLRSGKQLAKAVITLEEAADVDFELKMTLLDIRVKSYQLEGSVEEVRARLTEKWAFNYDSIELDYSPTQQTAKKSAGGTLTAKMFRPPGASDEERKGGGGDAKKKVTDALKDLEPPKRKSILLEVERELDKLEFDKLNGKKTG